VIVIQMLTVVVVVAVVLLALFFKNFHRDPERTVPEGLNVVAPADGRVLDVVELPAGDPVNMPKGLIGRVKAFTDDLDDGPHVLIPIFMNPFNVHVQRAPLDGTVLGIERHPGRFLAAYSVEALQNATVEMLMETSIGKVKVLQTAGCLVRHIHNHLEPGQPVSKGDRFGKIDFGSQVTLILPKKDSVQIEVKKDDCVKAGETIVATIREAPALSEVEG